MPISALSRVLPGLYLNLHLKWLLSMRAYNLKKFQTNESVLNSVRLQMVLDMPATVTVLRVPAGTWPPLKVSVIHCV